MKALTRDYYKHFKGDMEDISYVYSEIIIKILMYTVVDFRKIASLS